MTANDLIYRIVRPFGGLHLAKFLSRRHPRIMMYHRVNDGHSAEGISVDVLRRQLEQIKKNFSILSLNEMVEASIKNALPDNAVALTFDDGYRDFYELAYPLLLDMELPATLFIATGFVSGDLWLWPDKIKYIVNNTEKKYIEIENYRLSFSNDFERNQAWSEIGDICLSRGNNDKFALIDQLSDLLCVPLPKHAPLGFESLSWPQIREMTKSTLISIGSHSVSHPIMTKLNKTELDYELSVSKKRIETETGLKVFAFCYPNGQKADLNEYTRDAVKRAGYTYALAAYPSMDPLVDLWAIARYSGSSKVSTFEKTVYGLRFLSKSGL